MEITLYSKRRQTKEGKVFYNFLTTLTRKDGSSFVATVRFKEDAIQPKPENCPMNIQFDKADGNLSSRKYTREITDSNGEISTEEGQSYTLWISKWVPGSVFEDHSLDDII